MKSLLMSLVAAPACACSGGSTDEEIAVHDAGALSRLWTLGSLRQPEELDGVPDRCEFTIGGRRYDALPGSREDEILRVCRLSPDRRLLAIVYRTYRSQLRIEQRLPRQFLMLDDELVQVEDSTALISVRVRRPVVHAKARGTNFERWIPSGVRFRDGREYDVRTASWRGCGPTALRTERVAGLRIERGRVCEAADTEWCRVFVGDSEVVLEGQSPHPFERCTIDRGSPSVTVQLGAVRGSVRLSDEGEPIVTVDPRI